jgi:hypothetical protein
MIIIIAFNSLAIEQYYFAACAGTSALFLFQDTQGANLNDRAIIASS